jgi:hypothetical protein
VPNTREGYTTDDNARALIVSTLMDKELEPVSRRECSGLSHRYLSFLWFAFNADKEGSKTFSVTTVHGSKMSGPTTAMAVLFGLWVKCLAVRRMQD